MTSPAKLSPRILLAFACVYVFWGSTYLAMRTGVQDLPPLVLASTRFLIAGPLMLAICAAQGLKLRPTRRDLGFLALIGILMLAGGNTGCVYAEQYLASGFVSLLFAVIPLFVALLEAVLPHGERLNGKGWLGIGLGFAGLITLVSPALREGPGGGSHQLLGASIAVASAFCWSCASVLSRRARLSTPTFVAAAWEMLFAGVVLALVLAAKGDLHQHVHWTRQAVLSVAWLVTFGSLVGYTAYIYLLDHVPVAKVSTYAYINPIVAVLLGAILLHEHMQPIEYAGMAFILVAVYLVTSSKLQPPAPAPEQAAS